MAGESALRPRGNKRAGLVGGAAATICALWAVPACAYVGESFISIPGSRGHWDGPDHKRWIRAESNEWAGRLRRMLSSSGDILTGDKLWFGGPNAPRPGNSGKLNVTFSKANPDLPLLMQMCATKASIPELTYAESSDRARPALELGERPAGLPAYWEYTLRNVSVADCPVVSGAEQQAIVLTFNDIQWLNYDTSKPMANKVVVSPELLWAVTPTDSSDPRKVHSFLITWIAPATTTTDDQCPVMNAKPSDTDVFRYLSPEEVAAVQARAGNKGLAAGALTELRGPHRMNVAVLPGILPDPGLHEPVTTVALGLDLDNDDGTDAPPRGIRKHGNFVSPDGRTGIDNQLLRVMGCIPGMRGRRGYANQTPNARRADGNVTTLIEVSGIDDAKNDSHVEVAIIFSMDKPIRDNAGRTFIPGYTFRPTDDPNFALYNIRVRGRIVDGVVTTDVIPRFRMNPGQGALMELFKARLRLTPKADGSMNVLLGGYEEWRGKALGSGYSEGLFGYDTVGVYYALRRNADGLQDPETHEFNGISVAYEIDTVPAFLTSAPPPTDFASAAPR